jgi:geranylgeranyl transferase type-2 subunit beta
MTSYLIELALRLAQGIERLPEESIQRHTDFLIGLQRDDGGFAGRDGASDAYYTSFALRALTLIGRLDSKVAERATIFVNEQLNNVDGSVDFISTIFSAAQLEAMTGVDLISNRDEAWTGRVAAAWAALRRDDGGYAKTTAGGSGSTYHTFLIVLAAQLLDMPLENPKQLLDFVKSRVRDDGGFVEITAMRRSGTNPTAAAMALLTIFGEPDDKELHKSAATFLCNMQSQEGGLRANTRIPVADLLSTFTGLLTITDLANPAELASMLDLQAMRRYVEALEQPDGGFVGGVWDTEVDVEYTFYGLGSLALLSMADA